MAPARGSRAGPGGLARGRNRRSFDAGAVIEDPEHIQDLVKAKRAAREHRGQDRLTRAVPEAPRILEKLAQRNENLGSAVSRLLQLLDQYGSTKLRRAVKEALERGTPQPRSVRHLLETRLEREQQAPPIAVELPPDQRVRGATVTPHSLESYDELGRPPSPPPSASEPTKGSSPQDPDPLENCDAPAEDPS